MSPNGHREMFPASRGFSFVPGFREWGFKTSSAIGLMMSELLLHGVADTVDICTFAPNRFADSKPIKAEFEYVDD